MSGGDTYTAAMSSPAPNDPPSPTRIEPLLSAGAIAGRIGQMGRAISLHYRAAAADRSDAPLTVLGVMTGGLVFCADLIRAIDRPLELDVVHARSYRGRTTSAGELSVSVDMMPDLAGRHVLIVDDIFDTGATMTRLTDEVRRRGPLSVETAVLLGKRVARADGVDRDPTWVGFEIDDRFVVGYGLDFDGLHRNRPDIGVLVRSDAATES